MLFYTQGIVDLLIEDNSSQTLPTLYREALQHVLKGTEHGTVGKQVAMCNLVRRHLSNTSGNCEQLGSLKSGSIEDLKLLAEVSFHSFSFILYLFSSHIQFSKIQSIIHFTEIIYDEGDASES